MNEILLHIYNSQSIRDAAKRIGGALHDDLLSELLIIISETEIKLISKLYEENRIIDYCCKIMYYQYTNPNNQFFKKFRDNHNFTSIDRSIILDSNDHRDSYIDSLHTYKTNKIEKLIFDRDINEDRTREIQDIINKLERKISAKRYPSEIRLLYLYAELGDYRAVGREIGIHFTTVRYMVANLIQKIKKEYDSTYNR